MTKDTSAPRHVLIKKYANRRLYNTETSTYITLDDLARMVREDVNFTVLDARSNEDLTRSVLTQIILELESREGQTGLLPIGFLRQLINFYDANMEWIVPKYLEESMQQLVRHQDSFKTYFREAFNGMMPLKALQDAMEDMQKLGTQNMAMVERTMRFFSPFTATPTLTPSASDDDAHAAPTGAQELSELKTRLAQLEAMLMAEKKKEKEG